MPAVVTLPEIKAALNKSDASDDAELSRLIDAAEAEYAEWVGSLPGEHTETYHQTGTLFLPRGTTTATAVDPNGQAVGATFDSRLGVLTVSWAYLPLTVTYTVGSLPANHVEAIIADVAGLFTATQRGGGSAPRFPGEGYAAGLDVPPGRPVVLFPRIRALAPVSVA